MLDRHSLCYKSFLQISESLCFGLNSIMTKQHTHTQTHIEIQVTNVMLYNDDKVYNISNMRSGHRVDDEDK